MAAANEGDEASAVKGSGSPPGAGFLPAVSDQEALAAREAVARRSFVPAGYRLPEAVLPDPDHIRVLDQGTEGISVGVALAAVLNYLRSERGETDLVSPRMLYECAKLYDEWPGTNYEGSSLWGGVAGLMRLGVCLEREWPMYGTSPATPPAAGARPAAVLRVEPKVAALQAAVFEHHAVAVSNTMHTGWERLPDSGVVPFHGKVQATGGHAFAVIGYDARGFIVQNSWGESWGGVALGGHRVGGLAIWTYADAEANLGDAWVIELAGAARGAHLVGYDADSLDGEDLLEIKGEVDAFSVVLASRVIRPPLALGLFGDWGSGKSFFMQEMQARIAGLAALPRPSDGASPFCRRIVQIRFNAWHYLDTDLWASLVTEIFDRLFASIGGDSDDPEKQRARLTQELRAANGVCQQARQLLQDAGVARKKAQEALTRAISRREAREATLRSRWDDLEKLLAGDAAIRQQVAELSKDLAIPELQHSFTALAERVERLQGLGGRLRALLEVMFSTPWGWWRLGTLVAAMVAPVLVVLGIEAVRAMQGQVVGEFHSFALQVSAQLAGLTTWLGALAKRGSGLLSSLEATHRRLEAIRAERRQAAVAKEERVLQALREREEVARRGVIDAEQRVQALQREIDELQPGRLITRFIEERARSGDYRSRLGIVSLVRRDFERLSELSDPDSPRYNAEAMPVDRIVLYIDDLDRCKPERVIEVLEAVHLLLAFRLFMVVVAVDPRWLRHCLEKHYPDLLSLRSLQAGTLAHMVPSRPATAQDYLEKIFQIPFMLQPLKEDGFRRLIFGLTEHNRWVEAATPVTGAPDSAGSAPAAPLPTRDGSAAGDVETAAGKRSAAADEAAAGGGEAPAQAVERLRMRPWELDDMARLAPLFNTPRAVKRFVNTYRFLRAGVRPRYLASFEGEAGAPGSYRGAMVLLAVVVSYANVASRFLKRIVDHAGRKPRPEPWRSFLEAARREVGEAPPAGPAAPAAGSETGASPTWEQVEWLQLCDKLLALSEDDFPVATIDELEQWVNTVSRYSFSLALLPGPGLRRPPAGRIRAQRKA